MISGRSETTTGAHDTPPDLALELARRALGKGGGTAPVLDPACGRGELLLAAHRLGVPSEDLFGIELDPQRAEDARRRLEQRVGPGAARNIRTADALSPDTPWKRGAIVIANPPWASFSGRHSRSEEAGAEQLAHASTHEDGGWPSLHGAFLVRIAEHLANARTRAAVLVPSAVCELDGYSMVRRSVTRHAALCRPPLELGESAFPGVVEPAVLLELASTASSGRGSATPWFRATDEESALRSALETFPRLPSECFGDPGVHTGNAAAELLCVHSGDDSGPVAPIREGRDVRAYRISAARRWLRLGLATSSELRFRYGPLERYREVKVLLRQTADRPIAALHDSPTFFRNSLLACRPPDGLDPAFVVGVLNGPVAAAWHRLSYRDARQRTFPQVKVGHLRSLPFPISDREQDADLHDRVATAVHGLTRAAREAGSAGLEDRIRAIDDETTRAYGLEPDVERALRARAD